MTSVLGRGENIASGSADTTLKIGNLQLRKLKGKTSKQQGEF
ncbi:hypothetical protein QUB68_11575 [Microcoleus sp. A006_D1]